MRCSQINVLKIDQKLLNVQLLDVGNGDGDGDGNGDDDGSDDSTARNLVVVVLK